MNKIPLIILNGFLGAGKTTLIKNLLRQAHQKHLKVAAIVNDMSALDVDGVLVANTEIVATEHGNFVSISGLSISSDTGIQHLDKALGQFVSGILPDLILLETSGSSHPLPLVSYLRDHPKIRLKALLSLVDTIMLNDDYDGGKRLIPVFQERLRSGDRGIENLLAEQVLFSSCVLLTKNDRLPAPVVTSVAHALHPLNPHVGITAVPWGNLDLNEILQMPDYDFNRVALLAEELSEEIKTFTDAQETRQENIVWRVIEDDRPFHPQRLWDSCQRYLGTGVYRSKGFFWLPGRDDKALLWNQAAGSISLEFISYWKAGVLEHVDTPLTLEELQALEKQLAQATGRFGDRCCRLTVIGRKDDVDEFVLALHNAFLTEQEITWWEDGGGFTDPWPRQIAKLV
jgi:G3E family GTPase